MRPRLRVGYCRVSTATGEQAAALVNQRSRIKATGVDEILEDVESGLSQDRPGYLELLHRVSRKEVSEIVVTRLDRLGRDAAATDAFIAVAAKHGVKIQCIDGGTVESQSPQGFLLARIATSMAEVESRMLSLRVKSALAEGRKRRRPQRNFACFGYAKAPDGSALIPHPTNFARAQLFLAVLKQCGMRVGAALDNWEKQNLGPAPFKCGRSVRKWLMNPVIRGGLGYKQLPNNTFEEIAWNTHPALITHTEFSIIERQLQDNRRRWGLQTKHMAHLLSGICVCRTCNHKMSYASSARSFAAVICKNRTCSVRYKSTREDLVRSAINKALSERAHDIANRIKVENPEEVALKAQIAEYEAKVHIDPDLAAIVAIKKERLAALDQQQGPDPELLGAFSDEAVWNHLSSFEELRQVYLAFVQQVLVSPGVVEEVVLRL